jgi:hypothetical protein
MFFVTLVFWVTFFSGIKILDIYAEEAGEGSEAPAESTPEAPAEPSPDTTTETPPESTPEVPAESSPESTTETPTEVPAEPSSESITESNTDLSELSPDISTEVPTELVPAISTEEVSPDADGWSGGWTGEVSDVSWTEPERDPFEVMDELLDALITENEWEETEEKDPLDTTDEDPEIDLQDPSLESEAPAPEPEPLIFVAPSLEEESPEAIDESASLLSLLDESTDNVPLLTRMLEEETIIDTKAYHACRLEKFRADVTDSSAFKMRVKFLAGGKGDYEAEVWSLPTGIDVVFALNREYIYTLPPRDMILDLEIVNQVGSFDGDFSIPIIYRKKWEKESAVICQMNLLNEEGE